MYKLKLSRKKFTKLILTCTFWIGIIYYFLIKYRTEFSKCLTFEEMLFKTVRMDDKCLIEHIRKTRLVVPSILPYNLTTRFDNRNSGLTDLTPIQSIIMDKNAPWLEAVLAVETYVPKRGQRHFLECGALDGVTFSTTLHMERFLNWTGVLIEADGRFYSDLKHVHRKAYGVKMCASRTPYPSKTVFKPSLIYFRKEVRGKNFTIINPGVGHIPNNLRTEKIAVEMDLSGIIEVQCVPIYSVLLAVNMTTIDLFVLDVEGVEIDILETIPFEKVDIAVFLIEVNGKPKQGIKRIHSFLQSNGYTFYDTFRGGIHPGDDVFISKKYLKSIDDFQKLQKTNLKDRIKILTGQKYEDISKSDIDLLMTEFLAVWGSYYFL